MTTTFEPEIDTDPVGYFTGQVELMCGNLAEYGDEIPAEDKARLVRGLTAANEIWPVYLAHSGEGFLLAWNERQAPVSADRDDDLTPADMRRLADAIEALNSEGIKVRLGRSARGYTYLNVGVEH